MSGQPPQDENKQLAKFWGAGFVRWKRDIMQKCVFMVCSGLVVTFTWSHRFLCNAYGDAVLMSRSLTTLVLHGANLSLIVITNRARHLYWFPAFQRDSVWALRVQAFRLCATLLHIRSCASLGILLFAEPNGVESVVDPPAPPDAVVLGHTYCATVKGSQVTFYERLPQAGLEGPKDLRLSLLAHSFVCQRSEYALTG